MFLWMFFTLILATKFAFACQTSWFNFSMDLSVKTPRGTPTSCCADLKYIPPWAMSRWTRSSVYQTLLSTDQMPPWLSARRPRYLEMFELLMDLRSSHMLMMRASGIPKISAEIVEFWSFEDFGGNITCVLVATTLQFGGKAAHSNSVQELFLISSLDDLFCLAGCNSNSCSSSFCLGN